MSKMNMIDFIDSSMFSYQEIGARIDGYCSSEYDRSSNFKIVFFHSEHDQGKGNAVLKLFKQFAAFPVDIPVSKDCGEVFEMGDISAHPGTTVVVCAVPVYPDIENGADQNGNIRYFPQTWAAMKKLHATRGNDSVEQQISSSMFALNKRTSAFIQQLEGNKSKLSGNVIFLSGFSVLVDADEKAAFPETAFIPWNLTCLKHEGKMRSYDQPKLNDLLQAQELAMPQIENLDQLLEEVE